MPDRYTTSEAGELLHVSPERVRQLARELHLTLEEIGKARFLSPAQIKQMRKWLAENGYKRRPK